MGFRTNKIHRFEKGHIPYNKGLPKELQPRYGKSYVATDKTKKLMSESAINRIKNGFNQGFKKGHKSYQKKIILDEKKIVNDYLNGKGIREISNDFKVSQFKIYCVLKENNTQMRKGGFRKGVIVWNKGIKAPQISKAQLGKKTSKITKLKQSIKRKEYIKNHPEELERLRKFRMTNIIPKKDTSIEIKVQDFLTLLKIEYFTHKYINIKNAYQCDILIPAQEGISQKTIIECDGDYFHGNLDKFSIEKLSERIKNNRLLDIERTRQLQEQGYRVIRLWGSEINSMQLNDFQKVLI